MSFEEIFFNNYYYHGLEKDAEFVQQKKIFELFRNERVRHELRKLNIEIPQISEPTFRNRVAELVDAGLIRSKKIRIARLVHAKDIKIIMEYIIKYHKNLINKPRPQNPESDENVLNTLNRSLERMERERENVRKLAEKAKKGDVNASDVLEKQFKCKIYNKDELKEYERKVLKRKR